MLLFGHAMDLVDQPPPRQDLLADERDVPPICVEHLTSVCPWPRQEYERHSPLAQELQPNMGVRPRWRVAKHLDIVDDGSSTVCQEDPH